MKWSEFSIHTSHEAVEPICNILHEFGASGVVIEDPNDLSKEWGIDYGEVYQLYPEDYPEEGVRIKAYFPLTDALASTIERIKKSINDLIAYGFDLGSNAIEIVEVDENDWANAWKAYYKPIKVTDTLTITPTWERYEKKEGEIVIELDPGMAFGTGTHPTTILCLRALEKSIRGKERVIDVGTGSGVLSIAAAKFGAASVLALDIDDIAVKSASENVRLNDVERLITVKKNFLLQGIEGEYDIIVANILTEIIVQFVTDAVSLLKTNGLFITSGIIKNKEDDVKSVLIENGFTIEEKYELNDWVAIIAKKVER